MNLYDFYSALYYDPPFSYKDKNEENQYISDLFCVAYLSHINQSLYNMEKNGGFVPSSLDSLLIFMTREGVTVQDLSDLFDKQGKYSIDEFLYSYFYTDELFDGVEYDYPEISKVKKQEKPLNAKDFSFEKLVTLMTRDFEIAKHLDEIPKAVSPELKSILEKFLGEGYDQKLRVQIGGLKNEGAEYYAALKSQKIMLESNRYYGLDEVYFADNDPSINIDNYLDNNLNSEMSKKLLSVVSSLDVQSKNKKQEQDNKINVENINKLKSIVIGQDVACDKIINRIIGASAGFVQEDTPLASFLLTGPTGIGKTLTAKTIAHLCCNDAFKEVDMSTFKEKHEISRLLGAPAGYVGYGDKNSFADYISEHPNCVVLLDEIDKAHPDCLDIIMEMLGKGQFTTSTGKIIDLRNTIFFATTNFSQYKSKTVGFSTSNNAPDAAKDLSDNKMLRKEIIGRFNDVIEYCSLQKTDYLKVAKIEISKIIKAFEKRNEKLNVKITYSEQLLNEIVDNANYNLTGSRAIKNSIQNCMVTPIISKLNGKTVKNCIIHVESSKLVRIKQIRETKQKTNLEETKQNEVVQNEVKYEITPVENIYKII